ncbi:hypothetical protein D3Z62_11255 [Lachnospiraceae bacterium]|nr:hypothetical protein [Lachnospiraceae bacterium]
MIRFIKEYKRIIIDFLYSFVSYILPTFALQFVIQPLIARRMSAEENGLFITLFNVIKLVTGVFIMPLANLRLLKKNECNEQKEYNAFFNYLFLTAVLYTVFIGSLMNGAYHKLLFDIGNISRLGIVLVLISIHDYYMISFRIDLNYKKIVVENLLIVFGYGIGTLLFMRYGHWEYIFICGYFLGTIFVLTNTVLWQDFPRKENGKALIGQYRELSASSALNNVSIYCDRMIIYPVLGGYAVSVYNAASIVSKSISVVSAPLRNVLLSYIVNSNDLSISKRKFKRYIFLFGGAGIIVFCVFWGFSLYACDLLYPKYANSAKGFIPIIVLSIMIETIAGILNILLLRFAKTEVQTAVSALKLSVYLICVCMLSLILKCGLWGFCIAIMMASFTQIIAVCIGLRKKIKFVE